MSGVKVYQLLFGTRDIELPAVWGTAGDDPILGGLAPGRYTLELTRAEAGRSRSEVEWSGDTVVDAASLTAEPTMASVSGAIRFDGGIEAGRSPDLFLRNAATGQLHRKTITSDGKFEFDELIPLGTYAVGVGNAPGFFVWGISASGGNVSGTRIEIARAQPVKLSVVATRVVGRVDGVAMREGKPTSGAMIVMVPEDAKDMAKYRRDQSDSDGTFTLRDVLPGRYTVVALEDWETEWSDPSVMKKYLPRGEAMLVNGTGKLEVRVVVQK